MNEGKTATGHNKDRDLHRLRAVLARSLRTTPEALRGGLRPARREEVAHVSALRLPTETENALAADERYLVWRYFERHTGQADLWVVVLEDKVIAAIGLEWIEFRCRGNKPTETLTVARLADIIVTEKQRHLGLGAWLSLELLEQFPLLMAIGSNEQSRNISERLFDRREVQRVYKFMLNSEVVLQRRTSIAWLAKLGGRLLDALNGNLISFLHRRSARELRLDHYSAIEALIDALPPSLDDFSLGNPESTTPLRSRAYLRWRFAAHPERTFEGIIAHNADNQCLGYLIFTGDHLPGLGRPRQAFIADWRLLDGAPANTADALLSGCLNALHKRPIDVLSVLATEEGAWRAIERNHFILRNQDPRLYLSRNKALQSQKGWALNYADTDKLDLLGEQKNRALPGVVSISKDDVTAPCSPVTHAKARWREALQSSDHCFFQSTTWIDCWLDLLPASVPWQLFCNGENGNIACFLTRRKHWRKLLVFSNSLYLNETGMPEYDRLCIEFNRILGGEQLANPVATLLGEIKPPWDEIHLRYINAELAEATRQYAAHQGMRIAGAEKIPAYFVDLNRVRDAAGGYLSLLSRNTRSSLRRSRRRLLELGASEFHVARSPDEADEIYQELKQLHARSWAQRGQTGAFASPWFDEFHQRLISHGLPKGETDLIRVRLGGVTVGCLYNFVYRGRVFYYQSGFDYEAFRGESIGLFCHALAVEHYAKQGEARYEFLGGTASYKRSLATDETNLYTLTLQKARWRFTLEEWLRRRKRQLIGASAEHDWTSGA